MRFTPQKRIKLSFVVARTHRLLTYSLMLLGCILGSLYLFGMNSVAMKGYVLTKIIQENKTLTSEIEQLDAQISQFETREYLEKSSEDSYMVYHNQQRQFLVLKDVFTAQK